MYEVYGAKVIKDMQRMINIWSKIERISVFFIFYRVIFPKGFTLEMRVG